MGVKKIWVKFRETLFERIEAELGHLKNQYQKKKIKELLEVLKKAKKQIIEERQLSNMEELLNIKLSRYIVDSADDPAVLHSKYLTKEEKIIKEVDDTMYKALRKFTATYKKCGYKFDKEKKVVYLTRDDKNYRKLYYNDKGQVFQNKKMITSLHYKVEKVVRSLRETLISPLDYVQLEKEYIKWDNY